MQTPEQLNEAFAIEGLLAFDEPHPGMPRARITTAACTAELSLQGGHLTQWQPAGQAPVLFLSDRSSFTPGKAIRGGIPVIFPWFGAPDRSPVHPPAGAPSHGFARTRPWSLRFAAVSGNDLHLSLTLDAEPGQPDFGMGDLQLGLDLVLGETLQVRLSAVNSSTDRTLVVEQALHTYLSVGDIEQISIEGLGGTEYLDKTQDFQRKTQTEATLRFHGETDRPYLNTRSPVTLVDPSLGRRVTVDKAGSETTVVWNPGAALSASLPDLADDAWKHFVCIEAANAAENALTLKPGEVHSLLMRLAVSPL